MTTTTITTKGQIVIPVAIRKHLKLKEGTKLTVSEEGLTIVLRPLTEDYFDQMAGILKTKGKLTQSLMKERANERKIQDKKWSKY